MKTERRHELQENELANWLGEKISKIRPYNKSMLGIGVLGLVAILASSYITNRNAQAKQAGWSAYFDAMTAPDPASFEKVARAFPGTSAGSWALQTAADLRSDVALRQMFQNRDTAQQELQAARQIYQQLVDDATDPMLEQRATFGLAKCLEAQGEFDDAIATYEQVVSRWKDSQFANLAQVRLDELKRPATQEWYAWFDAQEPVRSPLNDPNMFQDLPDLPESPNLQMPEPGQLLQPGGASTDSSAPGSIDAIEAVDDNDRFQLDLGGATGATEDGSGLSMELDVESPAPPDDEMPRLDLPLDEDAGDVLLDLETSPDEVESAVDLEIDLSVDDSDSP